MDSPDGEMIAHLNLDAAHYVYIWLFGEIIK